MRPANATYGQLLFSRKTVPATGFAWVFVSLLSLALAALILFETKSTRRWDEFQSEAGRAQWVVGGLGILGLGFGIRRSLQAGGAEEFYENGASHRRNGGRKWLAYADVENVTYVVRPVEDRLERTLALAGPKGNPTIHLQSNGDEVGGSGTASEAQIENVSSHVVKAVAERIIERVDRGEVVKWNDQLSLDPAGLRLAESGPVRFVTWPAIDGVKDGSQSGKIEIYAFGGQELVATALTSDVNALPCYEAFMRLLDRGQAAAKSIEPVSPTAAPNSWAPGSREPRLRPR